jgi:hypothetical protein
MQHHGLIFLGRKLKPGGWIECREPDYFPRMDDNTLSFNSSLGKFWRDISPGFTEMGINLESAGQLADLMREVGFTNIQEKIFDVPIGAWHEDEEQRKMGRTWERVLLKGLEGTALRPLIHLGWRAEEVQVFLAKIRTEHSLSKAHWHTYTRLFVVYGRKPEETDSSVV